MSKTITVNTHTRTSTIPLVYVFYLDETKFEDETEATEWMNAQITKWVGRYRKEQFQNMHELKDWDGPL